MVTQTRFVAKNGLDNNSKTITSVADPVNAQDAATKNFSSNADNLTSGTVAAARIASLDWSKIATGKPTTLSGYGITDAVASNAVISAGTGTKITYDAKGLVTGSASLVASDIPSLDWSKIATGKPTSLSGFGITDGVNTSDVVTVASAGKILKLDANSKLPASITGNADGNAATATKLATARNIAGVSFDGSADISIPFSGLSSKPTTLSGYGITDAQGLIAAGTTGQYYRGDKSWATLDKSAVGLGNVENTALSTWAGSTNLTTAGNLTAASLSVTGNLTVNGTTTTVNSTTVTLDDPVITLGGDTAPATDDNKDRGVEFRWHNGTTAKVGFFGFDDSTGYFTFIPDASNTSEVFSGATGTIQANLVGNVTGNLTGFKNVDNANEMTLANGYGGGPLYLNYRGATAAITKLSLCNGMGAGALIPVIASNIDEAGNTIGKSATTVKLATARNIAGVSFDGSADISIPFSGLSSKPTTLSGYGITDALSSAGGALTGTLTVQTASHFSGFSSGLTVAYAGGSTQYGVTLKANVDNTTAIAFLNAAGTSVGSITETSTGITFNGTATAAPWSGITGKPTTLSGYGITDAATATHNHNSVYLALTGGTLTGKLISNGGDSQRLFESTNATASNAVQFFIEHSLSHVNIGNSRGDINVSSGNLKQGGNQVLHAGNYGSYAVPLAGGTMTGALQMQKPINLASATSNTQAVLVGNWSGAGWWGIGSEGGHVIKIDQVAVADVNSPTWVGAGDVTLKLGTKTVLDSGNFSTYAAPVSHASDYTMHINTQQNAFLDAILSGGDIVLDANITF